jgi:superfamily II DNA/RNA helicase
VSDRIRTAQIIDDVVQAIRRGRNCLVMAGRTEHVDQLAAELNARGLAPMVLHGSISPGKRRVWALT